MATDHALLERAATSGEAVLRIYAWARPTLSFGMHERARVTPDALAAYGVDVVRRPTGGRALLHDREVTYSITTPAAGIGLGESYRAINALLLAALRKLGVQATEANRRARATAPDGAACFAEPNAGELVVGGRKLVGSAQRRDQDALLQHGSILLADDQVLIARLRGFERQAGTGAFERAPSTPTEHEASPTVAATLTHILGRDVSYAEVRDALVAALRDAVSEQAVTPLETAAIASAVARATAQYRDAKWTWRR
jgi:lipoyl(octanoyl) transferase